MPNPHLDAQLSATAGIARFARIDNADLLRQIATPATRMFTEADWAELESSRDATAERLETAPNLLPRDVRHQGFYRSAFATEGLDVADRPNGATHVRVNGATHGC